MVPSPKFFLLFFFNNLFIFNSSEVWTIRLDQKKKKKYEGITWTLGNFDAIKILD